MHGGGVGGGAAFDEPDEMRDPWQVRICHFYHFQGVNLTKVFYLWRGQIWANFRKFLKPFRQIVLKITQPLNLAMK